MDGSQRSNLETRRRRGHQLNRNETRAPDLIRGLLQSRGGPGSVAGARIICVGGFARNQEWGA